MAIIWVSPTGSDSTGDGSSSSPYLTIEQALTVFTTGSQIRLADGTYTPTDSVIFSGVDGSLFSENPGGATIQPQRTTLHQACVAVLNSDRFTIQGVNILQAADTTGNLIGIYADVENFICLTCSVDNFAVPSGVGTGIYASGLLGRVENCDVSNLAAAGTFLYGIRAQGLDVIDCDIVELSGAGNCQVIGIDVDGLVT
jgi:hypothetical protein